MQKVFDYLLSGGDIPGTFRPPIDFEPSPTDDASLYQPNPGFDVISWFGMVEILRQNPDFADRVNHPGWYNNITDEEHEYLWSLYSKCSNLRNDTLAKMYNMELATRGANQISPELIEEYESMPGYELKRRFGIAKSDLANILEYVIALASEHDNLEGIKLCKNLVEKTMKLTIDVMLTDQPMQIIYKNVIGERPDRHDLDDHIELTISGELSFYPFFGQWMNLEIWFQIIDSLRNKLNIEFMFVQIPNDKMVVVFPPNYPDVPPIEFSAAKTEYCKDVIGKSINTKLTERQVRCLNNLLNGDCVTVCITDRSEIVSALDEILTVAPTII